MQLIIWMIWETVVNKGLNVVHHENDSDWNADCNFPPILTLDGFKEMFVSLFNFLINHWILNLLNLILFFSQFFPLLSFDLHFHFIITASTSIRFVVVFMPVAVFIIIFLPISAPLPRISSLFMIRVFAVKRLLITSSLMVLMFFVPSRNYWILVLEFV